jgi:hypothetical protein
MYNNLQTTGTTVLWSNQFNLDHMGIGVLYYSTTVLPARI